MGTPSQIVMIDPIGLNVKRILNGEKNNILEKFSKNDIIQRGPNALGGDRMSKKNRENADKTYEEEGLKEKTYIVLKDFETFMDCKRVFKQGQELSAGDIPQGFISSLKSEGVI